MNRFLTLLLGAAIFAAPLSAQGDASAKAAALLKQAQAAAAEGRAAAAADLARAAAELLAVSQKQQEAEAERTARVRRALEQLNEGEPEGVTERDGARVRNDWYEEQEPGVVFQSGRAAHTDAPSVQDAHIYERRDADPRGRVLGFGGAGPLPPAATPTAPAAPVRAPQQDEIGLTLKLIHAEVQALRAEVQALRAEMQLMRARGAAAAAPSAQAFMFATPRGDAPTPAAPHTRARALFLGPDGVPHELEVDQDVMLEWSDRDCDACSESEDGLCEQCEEVEDVTEQLRGLGYIGEDGEVRSELKFRFHAVPTLEDVFRRHGSAKPESDDVRLEIRTQPRIDIRTQPIR